MNIYHQSLQGGENLIEQYQIKKNIKKITINQSLEDLLFEQQEDDDNIFLIDESYCDLIRYPMEGILYEPLKIEQLSNLIEKKAQEIKKTHNIQGYMLMYDIENIVINDTPSVYILGQQGHIKRDIFLIFIKPSLAITCPNILKPKGPKLYPSSYFTIQFMNKVLDIPSFIIITFEENRVKLVKIKNGFYQNIETLDRGMSHLKQILITNNVIKYFSFSDTELNKNPMAISIVKEGLDFYNTIITNWIKEHKGDIQHCIITTPNLKNNLFVDEFINKYSKTLGGYILSNMTTNNKLNHYNRERQANELDVLTYMNFSEQKKLI